MKLTYHAISENRGVLTNVINNALIDEYVQSQAPPKSSIINRYYIYRLE
ncbi:MAG UNVERIFIED_CONTAM: hypothetical protein LVR29_05115 [Microcystis novacekii LVE1205-3]